MEQSREPILRMSGITKRFPGVLANDRVDLELYRGEVLALLGENGAGKSTLMNVLCGLYRQDEGEIYVDGRQVEIRSPRDAYDMGIGMVHQNFMLVETMTVVENVVLGLRGLPFLPDLDSVSKRLRHISAQYKLGVDPDAYIWQLSVGEQQRVEIIKMLYRGARVLILDEPTAVLTPQEVEDLFDILRRMADEGHSVILRSASGNLSRKGGSFKPRTTFSATVSISTSIKCWCTMPMPCWMASLGERRLASWP